jgi:hypothetical protein
MSQDHLNSLLVHLRMTQYQYSNKTGNVLITQYLMSVKIFHLLCFIQLFFTFIIYSLKLDHRKFYTALFIFSFVFFVKPMFSSQWSGRNVPKTKDITVLKCSILLHCVFKVSPRTSQRPGAISSMY